jgi:hypothetical protein
MGTPGSELATKYSIKGISTEGGAPSPIFLQVRILKDFKCRVLEVFILKGLEVSFLEVRILKELGAFWLWREEKGGIW